MTLIEIIRTRALHALAFVVGAVVAVAVVPLLLVDQLATTSQPETPPTRVERLIERYDCWSGQAPENTIPSRAVVTMPGRRARVVPADVGFGIWLDHDPGTLHAFCR